MLEHQVRTAGHLTEARLVEIVPLGNHLVVGQRFTYREPGHVYDFWQLLEVEDGLIRRIQGYPSRQKALRAADRLRPWRRRTRS